jgi:electron transfer flavoprotein beta subunit
LDPVATSQVLSLACKREEFDLILCGATAIDTNEGLEGPYVAERLSIPYASNVVSISVASDKMHLKVQRVVEQCDRQLLECRLPVLLTVEKGATTPRYPTLAGFLRAREARVATMKLADLGISRKDLLADLQVTGVSGYTRPKPKRRGDASLRVLPPAAERVNFMVNGDASQEKAGGSIVKAGSEEMFVRLDEVLRDAGVLKQ